MNRKQHLTSFAIVVLAIGIMVTGCAESETTALKTDVPEATPASITESECCAEKSDAKACCGECAGEGAKETAEQELAIAESKGCGDCTSCIDGDPANCKCAAVDVTTKEKSEKNPTDTAEATSTEKGHHGQTANFPHDQEVFHFLLTNHDKVTRKVTELENGVETLTESNDEVIVAKLQEHVAAMYSRVENGEPIRMRDPLYREVFKYADKIEMKLENTDNGIRVTETSDNEYVVKIIQAHAKVVTGFVEYGFEEAHKNHEPPQR